MIRLLDFIAVGFSVLLVYTLRLYFEYRKHEQLNHNFPGSRTLLSTSHPAGNLTGPIKGITDGKNRSFKSKHEDFKKYGQDAYVNISAFPSRATYYIADAAAIKEIVGSRARFPKPVEQYTALSFFGKNIVVSEFHEWKRFRKIASPAFNEKNNKLVWDETVRNMTKLFDNIWGAKNEVSYDHALDLTMPLALFIIASAGFGHQISWEDDQTLASGHKMTFKTAIHNVSSDVLIKLITPEFLIKNPPTKRLERVRDSFIELDLYLREMIQDRRSSQDEDERFDLFSNLLAASELEDEQKLTDSELIGNIFMFLIAGHETTAHTLCFAMTMLALYPEQQDILLEHIKDAIPDGRFPIYSDMPRLTQCMAVFYETLRMFPSVPSIPKYSAEDTSLVVSNMAGDKVVVPIPQGSTINLHVAGLHYNPRYWEEPSSFKPERFRKDWPKDAFIPFSAGARACIGRGFFETSGVAFLSILVARYKIEIKEEPQFAGETFAERVARVTEAKPGLTLTPVRAPLVFKRR